MSDTPEMMQAVRVHQHGDFDVLKLEQIAAPVAGPGQVRIRVAYAAINHLDTWVRRGVAGHKFPLPITPGCDFSGVIESVGAGVTHCKTGDRVAVAPGYNSKPSPQVARGEHNLARDYGIYGETCDGGNADLAVVNAENVIQLPEGFCLKAAAAFPLTYLTAWHMLVERCKIQPGDKVLVHAAGSGVSVAATQIAKLHGADVMVTAGSDEKCAKGLANGADLAVNYNSDDWMASAKTFTSKAGLDIIVDHVGADTLPSGVWALAKGGRLVTCGVTSGAEMQLNFAPIFFKSLSILGSTMGGLGEMHHVAKLVFEKKLSPIVDSEFDIQDIQAAHRKVAERNVFGKVIIRINE
ncbi:MAG: NADPH:quinone reductase-like Zn-dependent oxidoreductase [Myxococcota bacterium]|jgi:NADPH:quinone reductase-like Zn-dependent oxidoreductase